MEHIKKMSAGFHRIRRAHFDKKRKVDDAPPAPDVLFEKLSSRGRDTKARKPFAKGSGDPVHDERKRIFMEEIRRRARFAKSKE